jgi:succinate-semialdehyde dehydrogenase/glutarate-semialdehyde dehydrogenase
MSLSPQAIEQRLAQAHHALSAWRRLPVDERGALVQELAAMIARHKQILAECITRSMGKLPREAIREVERCVRACETMPALASQYLANETVATENRNSYITYQPLGVILGITPWNFPLWQVIRFAIPNILAGNTVVVKPAPNVFACAEQLVELFADAGFPDGVFQSLPVEEAAVEKIIRDPRVQGVALTGSVRAGRAVARIAGDALKKVVLELGGSDPFIVLDDADLDLAIHNACSARFMNAGQICVAAKRLLIHSAVADQFIARYVAEVSRYRSGDPYDEETNLSHLARKDLCDNIERQVQESVRLGAKVLTGGHRSATHDCGFEATVLDKVQPHMPVFSEEVFGPVSAIMRFSSDEEMLQLANDTLYGLGATIWTQNRERGEQIALEIDSGMVYINSLLRSDIRLPFGGIKQSGFGRELGMAGFREFTNIKTIVVN